MPRLISRLREAKGPRAFAFEVTVVVIGVLIALGAQEIATNWNWQRKVEVAERDLRAEQSSNFLYFAEMVTIAPCVQEQIERLRARLLNREQSGKPVELIDGPMPGVVAVPYRPVSDNVWRGLTTDGTVSHLTSERQQLGSVLYQMQTTWSSRQDGIRADITDLRVLAEPIRMDESQRIEFLQELGAIRSLVADNVVFARQNMAFIEALGNAPDISEIEAFLAPEFSRTFAYCRAQRMPLASWKQELAQGRQETRPVSIK